MKTEIPPYSAFKSGGTGEKRKNMIEFDLIWDLLTAHPYLGIETVRSMMEAP
jgi:hypothetical protein